VGDPLVRKKIVESLPEETVYASIIHPRAVLSEWVEVGAGSIITAGTIVTCQVHLGQHTHLNLHTTVGHDCSFGDYFTTAPGVNVSGNCQFGNGVYIGTNACVREGIKIIDNVTVGMGAVVVKDITDSGVYIGNPCKKL
jgi:sugar O-acyltransferase (sialic acid O-acetyltransferase NeuD family)